MHTASSQTTVLSTGTQAQKIALNHMWVNYQRCACCGLVECLKFGVQSFEIIILLQCTGIRSCQMPQMILAY